MKNEFLIDPLFSRGLQGYLFQIHRSVDRTLHGSWAGLVAYYQARVQPSVVATALEARIRQSPFAIFSMSRIRRSEHDLIYEVLSDFAELLASPSDADPQLRRELRTRVAEASRARALKRWDLRGSMSGIHEHYQDNPWQIPLPPNSYAGGDWLGVGPPIPRADESSSVTLTEAFARGLWLELYGLRRSLDYASSYVDSNRRDEGPPGLESGWPHLTRFYSANPGFEALLANLCPKHWPVRSNKKRLKSPGLDLTPGDFEVLRKPILSLVFLLAFSKTPSLEEVAGVHSTFEPAMTLLEVNGRLTALKWRARVRSFDDPEGRDVADILGAPWP